MSEAHRIAGQKGGQATVARHGRDHMAEIGKKGGRPSWQRELEMDRQKREERRKRARVKRKGGMPSSPPGPSSI